MKKMLLMLMALASVAHAQIGWTLDQCRKHWGRESSIEHPYLDDSLTTTGTTYVFGFLDSGSKIQKQVALDAAGKVNDIYYIGPSKGAGFLKIAKLLEKEEGVIWLVDPDEGHFYLTPRGRMDGLHRHAYWIGYKNGVAIFHARYYFGKRDINAETWGESLHILPIESPF
jgi:hypothetical protein